MTRMTDPDFLRWVAVLPARRRQPLYEATRFVEIADAYERLQNTNAVLKEFMNIAIEFMDAQGNGDTTEMMQLLRQLGVLMQQIQSPEQETTVTEIEAEVPLASPTRVALQGAQVTRVETHTHDKSVPHDEPLNVVEADTTPKEE